MGYLLAATLLLSASAIAYEILLVRLLSIIHWHHFAWMVISLALLGYGASGSVIALLRRRLETRVEWAFAAAALAFSVTAVAGFLAAQALPFNALEVAWNPGQFAYLALMYLAFMVPFFFAGGCIGLVLSCRSRALEKFYFLDLLGAGLGAALVVAVLFFVQPQQALVLVALLGLAASALALAAAPGRGRPHARLRGLQLVCLLGLAALAPPERIPLNPSEFKGLSQALQVVDSRIVAEDSSPLGKLTVVESPSVPFRHVPGLSLASRHIPPEQLALFTDADSMSVITRDTGDARDHGYLADMTASLPYGLLRQPSVLVLGSGAGQDVLMALHHGASGVTAVELNPRVVEYLRGPFSDFAGRLYDRDPVRVVIAEARGFVRRDADTYDLVQMSMMDSFAVSGSGVQALNENHLYTVEAMQDLLARLRPGGMLAITRWLNVPPRDGLKLAATLIEAMQRSGVTDAGRRLAMIRGWNTLTVLARNGEFREEDIRWIRQFARKRSFDVAWYPGMERSEANRFNRLDQPWFHDGVTALLGADASRFMARYKFRIEPATDDRPYFSHFFKWRVLPEVFSLRKRGGAGLVEWGYLVLVATLLQAMLAGALLILLPLAASRRRRRVKAGGRMGAYFFLLGLAFLFIEMAFIQKFILFLSHPLYAVAVVLAGFLVFAGLGSGSSRWFSRRCRRIRLHAVAVAVVGIAAIAAAYVLWLPPLFQALSGLGDAGRAACSLALIAPLGFLMGMPFPLGLRRIAETAPAFIPWAWAINGFASVLSTALAVMLAMAFGFTAVLSAAVVLYGLAALLFLTGRDRPGDS